MSDTSPARPAAAQRRPLVLDKPVRNSLADATTVAATRSQQLHVLPAGTTRTLCNIDTVKWVGASRRCGRRHDHLPALREGVEGGREGQGAGRRRARRRQAEPPAEGDGRDAEPQVAEVGAESAAVVS